MAYMFDVLTVDEAAHALSVSSKTVRRAVASGALVALDNENTGSAPLLLSQVVEQYRRDKAALAVAREALDATRPGGQV